MGSMRCPYCRTKKLAHRTAKGSWNNFTCDNCHGIFRVVMLPEEK